MKCLSGRNNSGGASRDKLLRVVILIDMERYSYTVERQNIVNSKVDLLAFIL